MNERFLFVSFDPSGRYRFVGCGIEEAGVDPWYLGDVVARRVPWPFAVVAKTTEGTLVRGIMAFLSDPTPTVSTVLSTVA